MDNGILLNMMESFDPEIFGILQDEVENQRYSLSLLPTSNAISPFAAYLKGSILGNGYADYHSVHSLEKLENLAEERVNRLFGSQHALVCIPNIQTASHVVLYALAPEGGTILSYNLRKRSHTENWLIKYKFEKFSNEPDTLQIDMEHLRQRVAECQPKVVLFSPVNYPRQADYRTMAKIAHDAGAYFWVDISQNAGLVAADVVDSPVPYADVVTFPTSDSLRGAQNAIVLTTNELKDKLEDAVLKTGFVVRKKNILASLAMTFREAGTKSFRAYCDQVCANAKALQEGLKEAGAETLCGDTENHLVLVRTPGSAEKAAHDLASVGLLVKADEVQTYDNTSIQALRLSSLDPTTRALREKDMKELGHIIGEYLQEGIVDKTKMKRAVGNLIMDKPLFSEEWLPEIRGVSAIDGSDKAMSTQHHVEAEEKQNLLHKAFHFWDN